MIRPIVVVVEHWGSAKPRPATVLRANSRHLIRYLMQTWNPLFINCRPRSRVRQIIRRRHDISRLHLRIGIIIRSRCPGENLGDCPRSARTLISNSKITAMLVHQLPSYISSHGTKKLHASTVFSHHTQPSSAPRHAVAVDIHNLALTWSGLRGTIGHISDQQL